MIRLSKIFLVMVLFSVLVFPIFAQGVKEGGAEPIVIGAVAARTGDNAGLGEMQGYGAKLAVKEINAAGGILGRQIELKLEDSQGVPAQAVAALNKLIYRDNVVAVIGDAQSSPVLAMLPVIKKAGIPHLPHGTNPDICNQGNPWVFRTRANDSVKFGSLALFLKEQGYDRISVLHDSADYGLGGVKSIRDALVADPATLVAAETFTPGDNDFSSQLLKLKAANPDALVLIGPMVDMGLAMKQARQMGLSMQFAGGAGIEGTTTLNAAGGAGEGLIFAAGFISANPDPKVVSFVKSFKEISGGKSPDDFAATGYDAIYILAEAIEKAGSTEPEGIQKALRNNTFKGVEGTFDFDDKGEGLHSMQFGIIKAGTPAYFN